MTSSPNGIVLVDKQGGVTSHDVVARARRALQTRKIGHAGTLDPMATGLLVLGVGPATRLLTYLVGLDKTYEATIRLGVATDSDDADGVETSRADAGAVTDAQIAAGIAALTGDIAQVPSTVSAIKVGGRRAYDLARAGEEVELQARRVTVSRFETAGIRRHGETVDVDVVVDCSSGTYIRALARDLGAALGVGGHLTALRRTRIGPFDVRDAIVLEGPARGAAAAGGSAGPGDTGAGDPGDPGDPASVAAALASAAGTPGVAAPATVPLRAPADVATAVLGAFPVTADEARDLRHGKRLVGAAARLDRDTPAAIDPEGRLVGIVERRGADVKSVMNMAEEPA